MIGKKTAMIAMSGLVMMIAACASVPETTRTGEIHDVRFEERMTPSTVRVRIGDEVRWINQRSTRVHIEFLGEALRDVVCQRGFDNLIGRQQEEATIRPNESVSLCFGRVGTVTYNARMDSSVAGGQSIESGTIQIRQ